MTVLKQATVELKKPLLMHNVRLLTRFPTKTVPAGSEVDLTEYSDRSELVYTTPSGGMFTITIYKAKNE